MDFARLAGSVGAGATAGSIIPGVGTTLGAVGGLVLDLAPELGRWMFGAKASETVSAVQAAVAAVTGSTDMPAQLSRLADPEMAASLRIELAQIAAEREMAANDAAQARLEAHMADVVNARDTMLGLTSAGSAIAWGAPVVSVVVLLTFGGVVGLTLTQALPLNAEPVLNVVLGTLGAMATSVVSYWVGSSAGSARKDARLASLAERNGG